MVKGNKIHLTKVERENIVTSEKGVSVTDNKQGFAERRSK